MTTRIDSPRVPAPVPQAPRTRDAAAPANTVAPTSSPIVAKDGFDATTAPAAPGVVPISQRAFTKPMLKFEAGTTVTAKATLGADIDLTNVRLDLNIQHAAPQDLVIKLTSPSGKTVTLDRAAGGAPNINTSFDLTAAFPGEKKGEWTLSVENTGTTGGGLVDTFAVAIAGSTKPRPTPLNGPVEIADLASRYGWAPESWQAGLINAADAKAGADGKITAAEVDAYLADPDDLKFLTSSAMQVERNLVKAAGGVKDVASFEAGWQQDIARKADTDGDGKLGGKELNAYITTVKAGSASPETLWMPDQKAAPFTARISDHTGEANLLSTGGLPDASVLSTKDFMRISTHASNRVPNWVGYELTAADVAERPFGVVRPQDFKTDQELGSLGAFDRDYSGSGYDRGHMKPARDSVNQESMDESMTLSNIAPQTAELNQRAWEMLEQATWELTQATGGKSTVFTGGLFLDEQGKPLPEDQKSWIGKNGQKMVAVPTHMFKAVLVRQPDGTQKAFAYLLPNRHDLPAVSGPEDMAALLRDNRVSIDRVEELLGEDLFGALDDATENRIEADAEPTFEVSDRTKFPAANLLWPAATPAPVAAK